MLHRITEKQSCRRKVVDGYKLGLDKKLTNRPKLPYPFGPNRVERVTRLNRVNRVHSCGFVWFVGVGYGLVVSAHRNPYPPDVRYRDATSLSYTGPKWIEAQFSQSPMIYKHKLQGKCGNPNSFFSQQHHALPLFPENSQTFNRSVLFPESSSPSNIKQSHNNNFNLHHP